MTETQSSQVRPPTSLSIAVLAARETLTLAWPVCKQSWLALLLLFVLQLIVSQYLTYAIEQFHALGREDLLLIVTTAGIELLFTLLWTSALGIVLVTAAKYSLQSISRPPTLFAEFTLHFNQLVIEQIRALASVLFRMPLLIIPALVRYVRLSFVPYVVLMDPNYALGKKDALIESSRLSRGRFFLLLIYIVFSLFLPSLITDVIIGENESMIFANPFGVGFASLLTFGLTYLSALYLLSLYRNMIENGVKNADLLME